MLALGLVALPLLAPALGGCKSHRLETGYEYEPLNSTSVERRAFYADPYSVEARRADTESRRRAPSGGPRPTP